MAGTSYSFQARKGTFYIRPERDGWAIWFGKEEHLGHYSNAQAAAEDLAGGHVFTPSCGDTAELGIPDVIGDWDVAN